ncbi:hypothetical protein, partial [Azospirillum tabaci]|uniref:hypothetical protein n=1 Tax=Azospirillum tabaci TaxID=2752310 RepID=UPI003CCDC2E6
MPKPQLVEAGEFKRAAKSAADTSGMVLVKTGAFGTKITDEAARTVDFVISTASEDRENDVISLSGWQLSNYRKNPVVLWAHDSSDLPVGKSLSETVDGKALHSTCQFATKDENP